MSITRRTRVASAETSPLTVDGPQSSPNAGRSRQESKLSTDNVYTTDDENLSDEPSSTTRYRIRNLASSTKAMTKNLINVKSKLPLSNDKFQAENSILQSIEDDPAFNPHKLVRKERLSIGGKADKTLRVVQTIATTTIHPKRAIKSKAARTTAGKISKAEHPHLSQRADLEFLEAYENSTRAASSRSSKDATSDEDEGDPLADDNRKKLRLLEEHRDSRRAAWTTSRHVDRVRVVPKRHIQFPDNDKFIDKNEDGHFIRYKWERWLGYMLIFYTQDFCTQYIDDFDELPFDLERTCRHHVERIVLASEPWQQWGMDVRSIYRWENPWRTGKWLALYIVLWQTSHVMGFLWAYIIYIVVKNRYYPTTIKSLRDSAQRSLDRSSTAWKFGELLDQHGRDNWLEPLIDKLGPYIQLQLGDIANLLEVLINFYMWRYPKKTISSLCFFGSCLMVSAFADMEFCMRIVWFIVGGSFFLCWPIASLYPKHRYLVSPFKWVLWDIPTHAEWSFQYLRRQAQIAREELIKQKVEAQYTDETTGASLRSYEGRAEVPQIQFEGDDGDSEGEDWHSVCSTASILDESDIMSFYAQWNGLVGRLVITSKGLRFVRRLGRREMWEISYLDLAEMRKMHGSVMAKLTLKSLEQMEFQCVDGKVLRIEAMKDRDEAFNSIVGFSGLQWQALQSTGREKRNDDRLGR